MMESKRLLGGKRIVFVAGEDEYSSEQTLQQLLKEAEEQGAETEFLQAEPDPRESSNLPGLENLKDADLAVFYLRFRTLPEEQFRHIREYVEAGKAIVAFRTSTHAFQYPEGHPLADWNDAFGIDVLGAPWIRHFGHSSSTEVAVAYGAEKHPILDDVPSRFTVRSWLYHVLPYPLEGATILLNGYAVSPELTDCPKDAPRIHPVAWTRTNKWGGRVFMTTMGHPEDFEVLSFRTLVRNGISWAVGLTNEKKEGSKS
ncbi:ThuA domain-containing protein [Paenibacillus mendelii]|uniref:ThuA domain-containing protein n=1 Tax=Paenibacillus mendelii TaxID=206163 RepID=A0ABV6JBZ4_9BACL|nr:ThuA domain-containing protein [Paenibacillus mendelii]MCQ6558629.1 ThuA domain-containing protein [Paenibacillus mendelii]